MATAVKEQAASGNRHWTATEFLEWLTPGVHADLIDGEKIHAFTGKLTTRGLDQFSGTTASTFHRKRETGPPLSRGCGRPTQHPQCVPARSCLLHQRTGPAADSHPRTFRVEAISPWTADRDTGPKFPAYEEHGVQEYWILDSDDLNHHFYRREGELLTELAVGEEVVHSQTIPGFREGREWLNPERLPEVAA